MAATKKKTGGLAGVVAGETAICTVGKEGKGLNYRGYSIHDLAEQATFEEVAFLLLYGHLPIVKELDSFKSRLRSKRRLPEPLLATLRAIPKDAHPMDVLRTGCSMLGVLEPEKSFDQQRESAERLLGSLPSMLVYWYRYSHDGIEIDFESAEDSIAGYFLEKMHDAPPSELHKRVMDVSLILYAEHEFNASTFTARVCTATLSDLFSAITGAIGTLRGPLHGGANEAAMELIEKFDNVADAESERSASFAQFSPALFVAEVSECLDKTRHVQEVDYDVEPGMGTESARRLLLLARFCDWRVLTLFRKHSQSVFGMQVLYSSLSHEVQSALLSSVNSV